LARSLAGLIKEYSRYVCLIALGRGKPFFATLTPVFAFWPAI
jgi:hypothetical protein